MMWGMNPLSLQERTALSIIAVSSPWIFGYMTCSSAKHENGILCCTLRCAMDSLW